MNPVELRACFPKKKTVRVEVRSRLGVAMTTHQDPDVQPDATYSAYPSVDSVQGPAPPLSPPHPDFFGLDEVRGTNIHGKLRPRF